MEFGEKLINVTNEPLIAMGNADHRVLGDSAPFVGVTGYGDNSMDLTIRLWCKTEDYWNVFFDNNKAIKSIVGTAGISIPFPQRDVHVFKQE